MALYRTSPLLFLAQILIWFPGLVLCGLILSCRTVPAPAHDPALEAVAFFAAECPICQKQTLTLNDLVKRYPEVRFKAVFTPWDHRDDIRFFEQKYHPAFPLYRDNRQHGWVEELGATVTPEVFLLQNGQLRYRGAIDNWFYAPGRHRPAPTVHYLADAIEAVLHGKTVQPARTEAIGCLIEQQ